MKFTMNSPTRIALCGFNCSLCPAFQANLKSEPDRIEVDTGWKKFHHSKGWIYEANYCQGCSTSPEFKPLWSGCPVRKCVRLNQVDNCGCCPDYPCPRINNLIHVCHLIAERTREKGTATDFEKFALPYQNQKTLNRIHQQYLSSLTKTKSPSVTKVTLPLPAALKPESFISTQLNPQEFFEGVRHLHTILEDMLTIYCQTPGGQAQELKRNKDTAKLLWTIGIYGETTGAAENLQVTISFQKVKETLGFGKYKLKQKMKDFSKHKIDSQLFADHLKIYFPQFPITALVLQHYTQRLIQAYGPKKAFSHFWKADLQVLA